MVTRSIFITVIPLVFTTGCFWNSLGIDLTLGGTGLDGFVSLSSVEYPDPEWEEGEPEDHGLSSVELEAFAEVAGELDSSCLMVIHDGVLVGEWYWDGFDRHTDLSNIFSVTKSITSILVGIAEHQGLLSIDDPASDSISTWVGTASEGVTIQNLISNDSGRFWSFQSDYNDLDVATDKTAYGVGLSQQYAAGTMWEYNNSAIQTLQEVLSTAVGQDLDSYAQENLFEPIGATMSLGHDGSGNPMTYQGVSASCDDLARLGYLALRHGYWDGQWVVPPWWLQEATQPSTALNDAYGYMWWLNRDGHVVEPSFPGRIEYDGQLIPASTEEAFMAIGAFGQLVYVDPEEDYVVVRLFEVPDPVSAFSTDPDPVGAQDVETLMTAFEAAKI
ncbi:serine hydrolase [Pseudenhygromyxa sp. WMMC2535]|uniref:serine hydrolase domain-containing protein n=1 Tax=Pseudenhygromyxa sp. WMMC2535 TaxID=2712867 RepID=UPI001556F490|nr:serine hydrolase [Pseudenhygromyxa sp. WMMC2535]NVB36478.1 serine hydrolase [Pseudenhygromyxa sp. WMMC2535]